MKTLVSLFATVFALATTSVQAVELDVFNIGDWDKAEPSIIIGAMSYHFDAEDHKYLNETHPAIGIELWDISVVYTSENSWEEQSFYVAWRPDVLETQHLDISIDLGFSTGYYEDSYVVRDGYRYSRTEGINIIDGIQPLGAITFEGKINKEFSIEATISYGVGMLSGRYNF
ncbi:hypothetical protein [Vibrio phage BONAISHI]|nr:hypothetical protein [Vibrio phage BONAISHI]